MDYVAIVESGAALMDERAPQGWRYLINMVNLDMASQGNCVAGQVFGSWWDSPRVILCHPAFGRDLHRDYDAETLDALRVAWVDYLTRTTPGTP